ncbi:hypothetical protein D3P07_18250 [Paenibacillus sp. 1011MAR3C5]|nr:hypothetical protein D3P07_18250 [Paenibacillus sp. 1011MAR3C5]
MLTASAVTGQLLFLPLLAQAMDALGWRFSIYMVAGALLLLVPLIVLGMKNHPPDVGKPALGEEQAEKPVPFTGNLFMTKEAAFP